MPNSASSAKKKLGEFAFAHQKWLKELTEFSPQSSVRAKKKLTEAGVSNRALRRSIRPVSDLRRKEDMCVSCVVHECYHLGARRSCLNKLEHALAISC